MQEIIMTTADRTKSFRDFFLPKALEDPHFNESLIFMGYDRESSKIMSAAAVYPSLAGARLLSISVSEERQRSGAGRELVAEIKRALKPVYKDFIGSYPRLYVEECFKEEAWEELGSFLESTGFSLKENVPVEGVSLSDIVNSGFLKKAALKSEDKEILPLAGLKKESFLSFEARIINEGLYPGLELNDLDPRLSMFYLEGMHVRGCVLMSDMSDSELMNEWVFLDESVKNRYVLLSIFAKCIEAGIDMLSPDVTVWFIPTDKSGEQFLRKVVPETVTGGRVCRYEMML